MATRQINSVLQHIRRLADGRDANTWTDHELLNRFINKKEGDAFSGLIQRHGPMVMALGWRILRDRGDAEDVFQATFMILAQKACSIRKRESIGGWLYRVAFRLALRSRAEARKRRRLPSSKPEAMPAEPVSEVSWQEVCTALDEELARLPDCCRAPLVLCYLEGKTQDEAMHQLGWSKNTFRRRLEDGRSKLSLRLTRRGITLSAGLWATLLSDPLQALTQSGSPAAALSSALTNLIQAAIPSATGELTGISPHVTLLVKETLKSAAIHKLKWIAILGMATALTTGLGLVAHHALTASPSNDQPKPLLALADEPRNQPAPKPEKSKQPRLDIYGDPLPPGAVQRLGTIRFRLPNGFGKPKLSPDGRTFVSAVENAVLLCDGSNGRVIRRFPTSRVDAVAFSRDGKLLAIGDADELRLWDITRDRQVGHLKVSEAYPFLFRPDGRALAVHRTAMNEQIALLDLSTGKEPWKLQGPDDKRVSRELVAFSADGKTLLVQEDRGKEFLFLDADTGRELRRLKGPNTGYPPVFSRDLKRFAAFRSADWSIRLWDVETGKELYQLPRVHETGQELAFSPDDKVLAWGRDEKSGGGISLIDVPTGKEIRRLAKSIEKPQFLAFWPNEKTLAFSTCHENTIRFWDTEHDRELRTSDGHRGHISSIVFSQDGKSITSSGMDGMIRRWDPATGNEIQQFKAHLGGLWGLAVTPDGKIIATASANERIIRLWETATGNEIRRLEGYQDGVLSLAFSPDGKTLASGGSQNPKENRLLRFWDIRTGKENRFAVDPNPVPAEEPHPMAGILSVGPVKFSTDGKLLAAACRNNVVIYELVTGRECRQFVRPKNSKDFFPDKKIDDIAFTPDGRTLVSGGTADSDGGGSIHLWELASGKIRLSVKTTTGHATCLALSPDGVFLAAATSNDKLSPPDTVRVLDARSGEIVRKFPGHESWLSSLTFSPDGKRLASGAWDTTILIWDVADLPSRKVAQPPKLTSNDLNELWSDLASEDAEKAYRAIWKLVPSGQQTVSFIREHLMPAVSIDSQRASRLIADFDNEQFAVRQKAFDELSTLGELAEPILRKKLEAKVSFEMRRRIETLLEKLRGPITSTENLQSLRAVEVLEHIGTPEALEVLETMSQGALEARLTQEAKASLERLAKRASGSP
jgi:RNA polymerase sigma factor (sigma-70 family)